MLDVVTVLPVDNNYPLKSWFLDCDFSNKIFHTASVVEAKRQNHIKIDMSRDYIN